MYHKQFNIVLRALLKCINSNRTSRQTFNSYCKTLLSKGCLIIAENYYRSIAIASYVKNHKTDHCGTFRRNRYQYLTEKPNYNNNYMTVLKWSDKEMFS